MYNLQKDKKALERETGELEDRVKAAELAADVSSRHLTWNDTIAELIDRRNGELETIQRKCRCWARPSQLDLVRWAHTFSLHFFTDIAYIVESNETVSDLGRTTIERGATSTCHSQRE